MTEIIKIIVSPRAKKNRVEKIDDKTYKIWVTTPPTDGKANKMAIKQLAQKMKVGQSRIEIIKGFKNKQKILKID